MTHRTDVLVIGGGPAGATAAFQLASSGVSVTLIDRAHFPRDKVCGESLSPGALARLQAIGMWRPRDDGTPDRKNEAPFEVRGMRIRSPQGTTFLGRYKGGRAGTGLVFRRTVLDHELLNQARTRGARVLEGIEATSAERTSAGGATIQALDRGGSTPLSFDAKRVVVADGRQSFLARQLGFLEPDTVDRGQRRYAVRAHCQGVSGLSDVAEMQVGDGGYCGIAPLSTTSANICYVRFTEQIDMTPRTMEADFRRHLIAFPEVARRAEAAQIQGAVRVIGPLRLKSRSQSAGPFIACGDTTGFLDPFTGEGIAHAIASGVLAAAAVRESLTGRTGSFRQYERDVRSLRKVKGTAALLLYGLVTRRTLANSAATFFARMPRLSDALVRLFGDQV